MSKPDLFQKKDIIEGSTNADEKLNANESEYNGKIPKYLNEITALLLKFSPRAKQRELQISMENTISITACGAAILSGQIIKILKSNPDIKIKFQIEEAQYGISEFASILRQLFTDRYLDDMFLPKPLVGANTAEWLDANETKNILITVTNDKACRNSAPRLIRDQLRRSISSEIDPQLIFHIITELAKNTIDHTKSDAVLGVEIDNDGIIRRFAYCEGQGFCLTLRSAMNATGSLMRLRDKGAASDLIHWATRPGHTTQQVSGNNYGLGLTVISECAKAAGYSLTMLDASSMIYFDDIKAEMSHEELRSKMVAVGWVPCLIFLGELK